MKAEPTKELLGDALITLCHEEPFEKITVKDLTELAKVNRQTFYYHYHDKQELLQDVYYRDCLFYLDQDLTLDNWEEQTLKMLKAIYQRPVFYRQTFFTSHDVLMTQLTSLLERQFLNLFTLLDQDHGLLAADKIFYAGFFAYGCSGVLRKWITENYPESPIEVAAKLFRLAKDVEFFAFRLYDGYQN